MGSGFLAIIVRIPDAATFQPSTPTVSEINQERGPPYLIFKIFFFKNLSFFKRFFLAKKSILSTFSAQTLA
jgi:hypothetical protein